MAFLAEFAVKDDIGIALPSIVSRMTTCGWPLRGEMPYSRPMRSMMTSRCNSPMPEKHAHPVSSSVLARRVGSSSR